MIGQPVIRDMELADIYSRNGFEDCLREISDINLSKKAMDNLYFNRQHLGMRTLVAVIGDFIVGTATIIIETKFIHNGGKVGHIEDVAVHPDFQRHGIGKLLMWSIIEIARAARCYKVLLDCDDDVIDFYNKLGFYKTPNNMRLDLE